MGAPLYRNMSCEMIRDCMTLNQEGVVDRAIIGHEVKILPTKKASFSDKAVVHIHVTERTKLVNISTAFRDRTMNYTVCNVVVEQMSPVVVGYSSSPMDDRQYSSHAMLEKRYGNGEAEMVMSHKVDVKSLLDENGNTRLWGTKSCQFLCLDISAIGTGIK